MIANIAKATVQVAPAWFKTVTYYNGVEGGQEGLDFGIRLDDVEHGFARMDTSDPSNPNLVEGRLPAIFIHEISDRRVALAAVGFNDEDPSKTARGQRFSIRAKTHLYEQLMLTVDALTGSDLLGDFEFSDAYPRDINLQQAPSYVVYVDYLDCNPRKVGGLTGQLFPPIPGFSN